MRNDKERIETLNLITDGDLLSDYFFKNANADFTIINLLIDEYNAADTKESRIEILKKTDANYQAIENKYSPYQIELCPEYRKELNVKLFSQLQFHLKLNQLDLAHLRSVPVEHALSGIIANLAPDKISNLLEVLIDEDSQESLTDRIGKIYQEDEPGAGVFQAFLEDNCISFLGGSNSKNFKITPLNGGEPYVLKVENRLGVPCEAEQHLRTHSLSKTLSSVSISRQTCYEKIPNIKYGSRNLLVTEFFHGGDIENYRKSVKDSHISSALNIYHQMASILQGIQNDSGVFPDMKNSNWLVDVDGTLKIADSKSFLFTYGDTLNLQRLEPRGYFLTDTRHLRPPEVWQALGGTPCSADKMHAFMLGKNLYQYLTACDEKYLLDKNDASMLDFSSVQFKSQSGKELKLLNEGLVKPLPLQRISVQEAKDKLAKLQLTNQCQILLEKINAFEHTPGSSDFVKDNEYAPELKILTEYYQKHIVRENCYQMLSELSEENGVRDKLKTQSSDELQAIEYQLFEQLKPHYTRLCACLLQQINQLDNRPCMAGELHQFQIKISSLNNFEDFCVLKKELEMYQNQVALLPVCQELCSQIIKFKDVPEFEKKLNSNETNFSQLRDEILVYLTRCECLELLKQINLKRFGAADTAMDGFLSKFNQDISLASSYQEFNALKLTLKEKLKQLSHPILQEIKAIIDDYRLKAESIFSYGHHNKADNIERAVTQMSIDARCSLENSQDLENDLKNVSEQIASKRLFSESNSFKKFKEKLSELKQPNESPEKASNNQKSNK